MSNKSPSAPRCAAIVGPYLNGKTTLLESLLVHCGSVNRKGSIKEGNTVGDASPEARARQMSTELNVASTEYMGEKWTFIDCPGSVELVQDTFNALMAVDAAVIVCEPDPNKVLTVAPMMKFLSDNSIPHILFINKMDHEMVSAREMLEALQSVANRPLVLRCIPMREGDRITGHIDMVQQRAFKWKEGGASEEVDVPSTAGDDLELARTTMLEALSDFDDKLLEDLLEDQIPSKEETYGYLSNAFQEDSIIPVFFGSAERNNGVRRLLKALRHEAPEASRLAERLGADAASKDPMVQVFKTAHAGHSGKQSFARVLAGELSDGMTLNGTRVSGLFRLFGSKQDKTATVGAGEVAALGRMEAVATGDLLSLTKTAKPDGWPDPLTPLFSLAIHAENRSDEVKLSGALAKLVEEDPSLSYNPNKDTNELLLWGQGEMHLLIAIDRLKNRANMSVTSYRPQVPYKETIRKPVSQHARHKKQSGGHGQFGDVHIDIKPLPRGSGFQFAQKITGGSVPKNYFSAIEGGILDYMKRGPLGFQVVDISTTLTDGQFHAVDSSDMAFRAAAQLAMREGMPKCNPVLLEPIFKVELSLPNDFTSKVQRLVSGRRGQILGFDAKPGWKGWDEVSVRLPQSEMHDLIVDLRSMTLGVGSFNWEFDHLQELSGRDADQVVAARAKSLKQN